MMTNSVSGVYKMKLRFRSLVDLIAFRRAFVCAPRVYPYFVHAEREDLGGFAPMEATGRALDSLPQRLGRHTFHDGVFTAPSGRFRSS